MNPRRHSKHAFVLVAVLIVIMLASMVAVESAWLKSGGGGGFDFAN